MVRGAGDPRQAYVFAPLALRTRQACYVIYTVVVSTDGPSDLAGNGIDPAHNTRQFILADLDGSGTVNAIDVQLVILAALNILTGYDCDVNDDGIVNALDVQLIINAALGI